MTVHLSTRILKLLILLSVVISVTSSLKCKDTFCSRLRNRPQKRKSATLDFGPELKLDNNGVATNLVIEDSTQPLKFHLEVVENSIFHVVIIDQPHKPNRYAAEALVEDIRLSPVEAVKTSNTLVTVIHEKIKALIYSSPFRIEFYESDKLMSVINSKYGVVFERQPQLGQFSIALDIVFPGVENAYGLPLHRDRLLLHSTTGSDREPYRLYNVINNDNIFDSTNAMHGSVPVLYAHGKNQSSGIFWLNPSQTWVDIIREPDQVEAYFMSETGALEFYILAGPTLPKAVMQYSKLTGVAPLPPYFALGYHQSRYSSSQYDVVAAAEKFASSDLPLDAIWLDVEYTDAKKYFTWDPNKYPKPYELLQKLDNKNVRLVAMLSSHLKNDDSYLIHLQAKNHYIRNWDGIGAYSGQSLPGLSSWLQFPSPYTNEFYSKCLKDFEGFDHPNMHIWNDMNEPTEYNEREKTLWGDLVQTLGGNNIRHNEIHNIYGFSQTKATYTAMLDRVHKVRPFILTSSHFAGSQRYTAVTTGNNSAYWEDLRYSFSMCLTEALAGISFCGADVGGFKYIPEVELYVRWYQAGSWLPFYRGWFQLEVPQREPYLQEVRVQERIRKALRERYAHIPYWYLLFRQHEMTGEPVIRPITYHYPEEEHAFDIDDEILVGRNVLVAPVFQRYENQRVVYLPGGETEIWYNINDNYNIYHGTGEQSVKYNSDSIPVFYRGGSIIPRKDSKSNSASALCSEKYSLYISPDVNGKANGKLYDDDCDYFYYKKSEYSSFIYLNLDYYDNKLVISVAEGFSYSPYKIDRIVILNPPKNIKQARYSRSNVYHTTNIINYSNDNKAVEILFGSFGMNGTIDINNLNVVEFVSNATTIRLSSWVIIVMLFIRLMLN